MLGTGENRVYRRKEIDMQEQLNSLLVEIEDIALKKDIQEIVDLIEEIGDLLGDDYEIYKLGS